MLFYLLYRVINTDNQCIATKKWNEIERVMVGYLKVRYKAQESDAKDAAQQTILALYNTVKDNDYALNEKSDSYLLTVLRNEFFRIKKDSRSILMEPLQDYADSASEDNIDVLIDEDEQDVLRECIGTLSEKNKRYIDYLMLLPEADSESFANEFNISVSNAWTIKHRLIQILNKCVTMKLNNNNNTRRKGGNKPE